VTIFWAKKVKIRLMTNQSTPSISPQFWKDRSLDKLSQDEWELLCDSCAKCCLQRLEDEDSGEIYVTNIVCRYLDTDECRCSDYANRSINVPSCVSVTLELLQDPYWLPSTCAYRLLAEGQELPSWHPLVSGTQDSVTSSGNSIKGRVVCETEADDPEYHLIEWAK
jgi:uncharacterized cysteine cluster protein YcgN (CxxCxxCC family)